MRGPKYCISSRSLALASILTEPGPGIISSKRSCLSMPLAVLQTAECKEQNSIMSPALHECGWLETRTLPGSESASGETQEAQDSVGRQWPQRVFWGWRYTFKPLQSQDGGLVAKSCPTLVTPWTVAHQALLSMEFSRQEYWSGLPFPPPGDLPDPGIEPRSPALQADSLLMELQGKPTELGRKS